MGSIMYTPRVLPSFGCEGLISERTGIPIPQIVAYRLNNDPNSLALLLILEHVEGEKLLYSNLSSLPDYQQDNLYRSLATILHAASEAGVPVYSVFATS
ncbi:hypothetical protein EV127DRAFT_486775 [Xylaria flabelliformis]|nr:hypothetical protein EV127DRAFT_486775 [Xylaria flabelliformis]